MREAIIERTSKETSISVQLNLDGTGTSDIQTPVGFFNHMLEAFSKHSLIDLTIRAEGDMQVDQHHTIEDLGIVLGQALKQALADKKGIKRAGFFIYPMDEALAQCAIDISGRAYTQFSAEFKRQFCGDFDTDLTEHFFESIARGAGMNIAIQLLAGRNDHHKLEAIFKAFAKSMLTAISIEPRIAGSIPSTKGVIDEL